MRTYKPTGRPRGRPKGSATKAKDVAERIMEAITAPVVKPVVPKREPKKALTGIMAKLTPEERSEHMRKLNAARKNPRGQHKGCPKGWTKPQHDLLLAQENVEIRNIIKMAKENGELPEDPDAVLALREMLKIVKASEKVSDRIAAARLFLDFKIAKPAAKKDVTISTPESIIRDLMSGDDED